MSVLVRAVRNPKSPTWQHGHLILEEGSRSAAMCMRLMLQAAPEAVRPQSSVALRRLLPEYDADSSEDSSRRCLLQLIMINRYRNDTRLLQKCLIDVEIVICLGQLSAGDDDSRYMQIQQQC